MSFSIQQVSFSCIFWKIKKSPGMGSVRERSDDLQKHLEVIEMSSGNSFCLGNMAYFVLLLFYKLL